MSAPPDVFLVASPTQLLNALEARHHFGVEPGQGVLVLAPIQYQRDDLEQFRALVRPEEWEAVHTLPARPAPTLGPAPTGLWERATALPRMLRPASALSRRLGRVGRVFVGHYADRLMRHFANVTPHGELVLLDDGMATLRLARLRASGGSLDVMSGRRLAVREWLFGARFDELESVTFFTSYDLEAGPADTVVRHDYPYLRSLHARGAAGRGALFLGAPLPELGLVEEGTFFRRLRQAREHLGGEGAVYAPHRAESPEKLARLEGETGMEVRRLGMPVEWHLLRSAALPRVLASFYSSGLDNCVRIFGREMRVVAFRLAPGDVHDARFASSVEKAYEYLEGRREDGIEVIPLTRGAEEAIFPGGAVLGGPA